MRTDRSIFFSLLLATIFYMVEIIEGGCGKRLEYYFSHALVSNTKSKRGFGLRAGLVEIGFYFVYWKDFGILAGFLLRFCSFRVHLKPPDYISGDMWRFYSTLFIQDLVLDRTRMNMNQWIS